MGEHEYNVLRHACNTPTHFYFLHVQDLIMQQCSYVRLVVLSTEKAVQT